MVAQTIILELGAKWQNAQMQVTQNESNRPFVFKVKTNEGGFVDLSQYNVKIAINTGTEALVYTVSVQHNTEGHISIPSKATENPGTFDCWLILIADDVEIRLDGLSMTVTPCNINSLVDSDTGDGGFFEELQEAADTANAAASTATSAAQAANAAADRANNIADSIEEAVDGTLINDSSASSSTVYSSEKIEDDFVKNTETIPIARGGTGATSATAARSALGAAATSHTHSLSSTSLTGTLPISKGGTGATTSSAARSALGAASSTHTHALTSTSLTGMLPITKGGTGSSTAAGARSALGAMADDKIIPIAQGGTGGTTAQNGMAMLQSDGSVGWHTIPLDEGITPGTYGTRHTPSYRKIGNEIIIEGGIACTLPDSGTITVGTLPAGYRPLANCYKIQACSNTRVARVYINTSGMIGVEWVVNLYDGNRYTGDITWIQIDMRFFIDGEEENSINQIENTQEVANGEV